MSIKDNNLPETEDYSSLPPSDISGIVETVRRRRRHSENKLLKKIFKSLGRTLRPRVLLPSLIVITLVVALLLSVLLTDATVRLADAWQGLNRVMNSISGSSGTDLTLSDFNRLQSSLEELATNVDTARSRLALLGPLVSLNSDWQASNDALVISDLLTDAALDMLTGLQPALDFMVQGDEDESVTTGISSGQRVVELLDLGRGRFLEAQDALQLAEVAFDELDLSNVSTELLLQIEQLRSYHAQLLSFDTVLLSGSDILTTMLGLDEQRTYLVLAQNNDELRPSGGYISTYGWFIVDGARIIEYDYHPTTTTSPNPPTEVFLESFEVPSWWIRYGEPIYAAWDGSWYADFPSTAQMSMNYYHAGGNPQSPVDGVLAIDISGFELILDAMGEVSLPDYNIDVSRENFRQVVYDIRASGQGEAHKQFVADVYRAIFTEWRSLDQSRVPALFGALLDAVQSRHLMIYFADEELNQALGLLGWNGAQIAGTGHDYIMVADANLGNKSNNSIIRSLTYDVTINTDGSVNSRLSVRYDYFDSLASSDPAVDDAFHGPLQYNNLMQIFLPANTSFLGAENLDPEYIPLENHSLLVGQTSVSYDTSERYSFDYQTPVIVEDFGDYQRYRLLIQKQLGARLQLTNIQITLPENASLMSSNPEPDANYSLDQTILDYRLELDGDFWLEVIYQSN
jgi:hypothetical protein